MDADRDWCALFHVLAVCDDELSCALLPEMQRLVAAHPRWCRLMWRAHEVGPFIHAVHANLGAASSQELYCTASVVKRAFGLRGRLAPRRPCCVVC